MRIYAFCYFIMFYSFSVGQNIIEIAGTIVDDNTGSPLRSVNVYFANTTLGTITNSEGKFKILVAKHGVLNLVISHIGYQTKVINVTENKNQLNLLIKIKPISYEIESITVMGKDPMREFYLQKFTEGLIGTSINATRSKILNPAILQLNGYRKFKGQEGTLSASADSVLIIKNGALGYTIKYDLEYFKLNNNELIFYGYPLFEDWLETNIKSNPKAKRRRKTYEGSRLHFFRSLYSGSLEKEGFEIYRILEIPKDSNDNKYYGILEDSLLIGKPGTVLVQTQELLNLYDYVKFDSVFKFGTLTIDEFFEIRYVKRGQEYKYYNSFCYHESLKQKNWTQVTIVKLKQESIQFYPNGSFDKSDDLITIGYWSYKRLADLLPYDYQAN